MTFASIVEVSKQFTDKFYFYFNKNSLNRSRCLFSGHNFKKASSWVSSWDKDRECISVDLFIIVGGVVSTVVL